MIINYSHHLNHTFLKNSLKSGIKLGLTSIKTVLKAFGNPHKNFKSIHIAGTNGKGSTARIISTSLSNAGIKTGLFTSPHIMSIHERFQINDRQIKTKELIEIINEIEKVFNVMYSKKKINTLTYFEICTIAAFLWFSKRKIDIAVIETGMGGRFDSTNVIRASVVIITSIAKDHQKYLGNKLEDIAFEKAGIIHKNSKVVLGQLNGKAKKRIMGTHSDNIFYCYGKDFKSTNEGDLKNTNLYWSGGKFNKLVYALSLRGEYQMINASCAIKGMELLRLPVLTKVNLKLSLKKIRWKGRFDVVRENPLLVFDAAHNTEAMLKLKNDFCTKYSEIDVTCIAGFSKDKNYMTAIKILTKFCKMVYLVPLPTERSFNHKQTAFKLKKGKIKNVTFSDSFEKTIDEQVKKNSDILVCGSFYLLEKAYRWHNAFKI